VRPRFKDEGHRVIVVVINGTNAGELHQRRLEVVFVELQRPEMSAQNSRLYLLVAR